MTYLGDASDHVANVRFERVDSARLLGATEPDSNTDKGTSSLLGALLHFLELTSDVREVLGHGTSRTLDCNFPCFHCACNYRNKANKRGLELSIHKSNESHLGHVPSPGISTQSSFNICLILLISSLLNNNQKLKA